MLRLFSRNVEALSGTVSEPFIVRVADQPTGDGQTDALLLSDDRGEIPSGFRAYLFRSRCFEGYDLPLNSFLLGPELEHVSAGDVLRIHPRQHSISLLYRRSSDSNSLLV